MGLFWGAVKAVARAFVVSVTLAALMVLMAFGFIYFQAHLEAGGLPKDITMAMVLVVFALAFVATAVLLDRSGIGQAQALVGGAILALGITVLVTSVAVGVYYVSQGMMGQDFDRDTLLTGFAVAIVASVIIDRLVLKI